MARPLRSETRGKAVTVYIPGDLLVPLEKVCHRLSGAIVQTLRKALLSSKAPSVPSAASEPLSAPKNDPPAQKTKRERCSRCVRLNLDWCPNCSPKKGK
jgi:hypothetical protein